MPSSLVVGVAWPGSETSWLEWILAPADGEAAKTATDITTAQKPLLPWAPKRDPLELWQSRVTRWNRERTAPLAGDIAWFYAPYLSAMLSSTPELKVVWVKGRPEDVAAEMVALAPTTRGGHRINHFSRSMTAEETRDPVLTRTFPKVDENNLFRAAMQAVLESQALLEQAHEKYPERVLVVDRDELPQDAAHAGIRTFAGLSPLEQTAEAMPLKADAPKRNNPIPETDPRRCVILVPYTGIIHPECEDGLKELERRGYTVRRVGGYAAIDQGRNQMATDALMDGFDETFWIDSDVGFRAEDVEKLRAHRLPIVCGVYPQKGRRALAIHVMPGSKSITFGNGGGLTEILYAATGFLHVRREAYLRILDETPLTVCNERFNRPTIPWFEPLVREIDEGHWYLAEDFAFCQRARSVGYKIFADTSIRLWHVGNYRYSWEDAGIDRERFATFTLNLGGKTPS